MRQSNKESGLQIRTLGIICFRLVGPLLVGSTFGERVKSETIDAQAIGTGTQLGQNIGISVIIYETEPGGRVHKGPEPRVGERVDEHESCRSHLDCRHA